MADWGDGVFASCTVGLIVRQRGPISCHFRDCKAPLVTSLTHVSGAYITSVETFTFTCVCGRGSAPNPAGSIQRFPRHSAEFKGPLRWGKGRVMEGEDEIQGWTLPRL